MEEKKKELIMIIESINNEIILDNLCKITVEYVRCISSQRQKSAED